MPNRTNFNCNLPTVGFNPNENQTDHSARTDNRNRQISSVAFPVIQQATTPAAVHHSSADPVAIGLKIPSNNNESEMMRLPTFAEWLRLQPDHTTDEAEPLIAKEMEQIGDYHPDFGNREIASSLSATANEPPNLLDENVNPFPTSEVPQDTAQRRESGELEPIEASNPTYATSNATLVPTNSENSRQLGVTSMKPQNKINRKIHRLSLSLEHRVALREV